MVDHRYGKGHRQIWKIVIDRYGNGHKNENGHRQILKRSISDKEIVTVRMEMHGYRQKWKWSQTDMEVITDMEVFIDRNGSSHRYLEMVTDGYGKGEI